MKVEINIEVSTWATVAHVFIGEVARAQISINSNGKTMREFKKELRATYPTAKITVQK